MIYLIFLLQILMVLGIAFVYLTGQNKLFHLFPREKDSGTTFTKEELINWQNTLATMLQETETLSVELTVKLTKRMEELEGKIKLADEKIKEIKELVTLESPSVQPAAVSVASVVKPLQRAGQIQLPINPRHIKIFELADQGWTITDIARETNVGRGEVQLILGLRREEKSN